MIIQKQKPFAEIQKTLEGYQRVFIAGCADCATACKTGGEEEIAAMKTQLEGIGKTVTGTAVFDTACLLGEVRKKAAENQAFKQRLGATVGDAVRHGNRRDESGIDRGSFAPKTPRGQSRKAASRWAAPVDGE